MSLKIACIGSAPSSVQLAPYNDPSWKIIACSPGASPFVKRCDAWVEIHRWEPPDGYTGPKPWFTDGYIGFMRALGCPVYMAEPVPQIPNSVAYPKDEMLEEFGPYFCTNSLSWMVMLAVKMGATEISLWGVDMAARSEWEFQRTGLQCLLWHICDKNKHSPYKIKVTLPPESDLWVPPVLYGFVETNPHHIKLMTRREELRNRYLAAQQNFEQAKQEMMFLQGAQDDNDYHINTWAQDRKALDMAFGDRVTTPVTPQKIEAIAEALAPDAGTLGTASVGNVMANGHIGA